MSPASRINLACVVALLALQAMWHGAGAWPGGTVALLVLFGAPLAGVLLLHLLRRPSARFWTAVVALFTFCHGVVEAWTLPAALLPGLSEAAISALAVGSASWDGMKARFGKRPPPATL